ncbi:MAG: hypothetical protein HYU99_10860 [Deltaproteobacteria bacterium]|nr:hypothetical protein [Deltaproteobacteria bacterium]
MLSILLSCQGIPADKPLKFPDEEETGDSGGAGECQPDACSGYLLVNPEDETEGTCISFADQADEA